ncbi:MAG: 2-heptaprenyl,4-naphthoquinone methyltransferase [Myxococcaceae bacterium]|nr:2-heptaprenyl,4-naphthoquinone methyltransferase [Myxococcaceae bacterium]
MTSRRPVPTADEVWRTYDAAEARLTAPLCTRMLDLARVGPGMRVLDLAAGRGEPAIAAAHRVGPVGSVLGVDLSADMLAMAAERAAREAEALRRDGFIRLGGVTRIVVAARVDSAAPPTVLP